MKYPLLKIRMLKSYCITLCSFLRSIFLFFLPPTPHSLRDLSSSTIDWTQAPAVKHQAKFPGGPVVKESCLQVQGDASSTPSQGTESHATEQLSLCFTARELMHSTEHPAHHN